MEKKFTVECEMEERWIPHFLSMLEEMHRCGAQGSSRIVAFYSDGDGDYRPRFSTDYEYEFQKPSYRNDYERKGIEVPKIGSLFDAG